jgi:hypothetical protein
VKSSSRTLSVPLQNSKEGLLHAFNERFLDVPQTHFPPDIEAVRQVLISVRVRQLVKTGRPITSQSSKSREVMHKGSSSRDRAEDTTSSARK